MAKKVQKQINKEMNDLKAALNLFPKIVREKKQAHKKNEKIIKRFMSMARKLDQGKLKIEKS